MSRLFESLQWIAVTLWVGGLWTVGFGVAPTLFRVVGDRAQAGTLAGQFFTLIAYVGLSCAAYLLLYRLLSSGTRAWRQPFFWVVAAMAALALIGQFGVQPILSGLQAQALPQPVMESVWRDRFTTWHGVASALYVAQSLLGVALVLLQGRR